MWLSHPQMSYAHGFSTAANPFTENVLTRTQALHKLNISTLQHAVLHQIHGDTICMAHTQIQTGDALVCNSDAFLLIIKTADCYPVLIEDTLLSCCAAVHAGWRGVVSRLVSKTLHQMCTLGSKPENLRICIGPGICTRHFKIKSDVSEQLAHAGYAHSHYASGYADLRNCLVDDARAFGISKQHIYHINRCTFEHEFFSYRRDQGDTGRLWSVIQAPKR
ncbi:MAG: laccase domain-containing protein [Sphingobacteriia bacterium]|jgi:YfiH family protein|nr:laccase domain-containing protein [Sphingobacteriia bacterium]